MWVEKGIFFIDEILELPSSFLGVSIIIVWGWSNEYKIKKYQ